MKINTVIAIALALGIVLFTGCQPTSVQNEDVSTTSSSQSNGNPTEETTNDTVYDVRFFNSDDKKISEETGRIAEIQFPSLADVEKEGFVFVGWDTDIKTMQKKDQSQGSGINDDTTKNGNDNTANTADDAAQEKPQSVEIKPVYVDIRDKENVVAMPAVYGKTGEQFTVPLILCGKVNLCGIDICIHYNRNKLKLIKFENVNKDVVCNSVEEKGDFHLNYISTNNVTEDIYFCYLVFEVINEKGGEEDLNIEIVEIVAFGKNDELFTPETNVIDSKIYAY